MTALAPLLHVALHEPEIPNNTGNIGRTCVATGCALHLIEPLGFDTSEKACRRAGLDYWPRLNPQHHASLDGYLMAARPQRLWLLCSHAAPSALHAPFQPGDHLLFGKETRGLPPDVLARFPGRALSLPMIAGERSLNLATAVCAVLYLAIDRLVRDGHAQLDPQGRLGATPRA
jgi:tRNA (cytidine/uridine-2'-O-)-methyltransferase